MTPESFKERAQAEVAFKQMTQGMGEVQLDGLRGCLMMATQMALNLKLSAADLNALLTEEFTMWGQYLTVKRQVLERRKEKTK